MSGNGEGWGCGLGVYHRVTLCTWWFLSPPSPSLAYLGSLALQHGLERKSLSPAGNTEQASATDVWEGPGRSSGLQKVGHGGKVVSLAGVPLTLVSVAPEVPCALGLGPGNALCLPVVDPKALPRGSTSYFNTSSPGRPSVGTVLTRSSRDLKVLEF